MLVLGRKENETIHIGGDITIRVVKVRFGQVRIGIEAPDALQVLRGELIARDRDGDRGKEDKR